MATIHESGFSPRFRLPISIVRLSTVTFFTRTINDYCSFLQLRPWIGGTTDLDCLLIIRYLAQWQCIRLVFGRSRIQIPSGAWFLRTESYQQTLKLGSYCFHARCTAWGDWVTEMWGAFIRWNSLSNAHGPRLGLFPGAQVQPWASCHDHDSYGTGVGSR